MNRILVLLFLTAAGTAQAAPTSRAWTPERQDGVFEPLFPIRPQFSPAMVYDTARERLLVLPYGTDEVWAQDIEGPETGLWVRLAVAGPGPGRRYGAALVYDRARDRVILYGGAEDTRTWALDLGGTPSWTILSTRGPGSPEEPRYFARAIHDPLRDRVVLYGGNRVSRDPGLTHEYLEFRRNDVWVLPLSGPPAWSPVLAAGDPPDLMTGPIALYDSRRDRLALFGPSVSGPSRRSLWTLSLSGSPVWQNEMLPGHHGPHPPWFAGSAAAYDPLADRIFVHAGYYFYVTEGGLVTGGLFEADLANWTARFLEHTGPEPDRRWGHGAAYDPVHNRLFIFGGGRTSGAHSELFDTWALSLGGSPRWDRIGYLQGPPQRRLAQSHLYDPLRDRLATLFGWDGVFVDCIGGSAGYYNDAWTFELSSPEHWNVVNPTTPLRPFYRSHGAMALDSSHDRIAHFGGRIDPCSARPPVVDELIAFNLGESPSWEILPQGNPRPSARGGALAFEDRLRNRMVMIGDVVDEQGQPEVWSLGYDDLRWTRHAPVGPGPAAPLEGCYDARRDRGLFLASRSTGELWALSLKEPLTWSRLDVPETIPSGTALNVVLDTARDRLVASVDRSLLGLDLTTAGGWYLIQTAGPDEPSPSNSMYDPVRDRLLFEVGPEQGSMWALSWGEPVHDVALMRVTGGRSRGRILLALVSKAPVESALWPRPFDVGSVDESSLRFNGVKPLAAGWHDPHTQKRDVDGDGLDDLVVHLDGDVLITRDRIVRLEGFTDDGARLRGELDLDAIEASPADNNATLTRAASRGLTLSRITRVAGAIDVLLTCDSPGPVHVAVFDARGRLIERQKVASSNEPRRLGLARGRTLAGGIYFVEARQGDVRAHVRVAWPGGRTVP